MIYIICTSGLHKEIAEKILQTQKTESVKLIYLPKEKSRLDKILRAIRTIPKLLCCAIDNSSHAIIPHPFNAWFSLFILTAKKRSFYDDGIAYYYKAKLPTGAASKIYNLIIRTRKITKNKTPTSTYIDFLNNCKYEKFYCLFPHLLDSVSKKSEITITEVPKDIETGITVYADSTEETIKKLDSKKILDVLIKQKNESSCGKIFFKPHPSQTSEISRNLREMPWAEEIHSDLEKFIKDNPVQRIYSIYSSVIISASLISPKTRLYCITNSRIDDDLKEIKDLYSKLNVNFINAE